MRFFGFSQFDIVWNVYYYNSVRSDDNDQRETMEKDEEQDEEGEEK